MDSGTAKAVVCIAGLILGLAATYNNPTAARAAVVTVLELCHGFIEIGSTTGNR